jgi:hypothetical protein
VPFSVLNSPVSKGGMVETESVPFSVLNAPGVIAGIVETGSYVGVKNQARVQPQAKGAGSQTPSPEGGSAATPTAPVTTTATASVDPFLDSDGDGLPDWFELLIGTNPNNPDTDGDGLTDFEEVFIYHTDPLNPDTDGDGFSDGLEVLFGSNPLDPNSTPLTIRNPGSARLREIPAPDVDRNKKIPATNGGVYEKQRQNQ